MTSAPYRFVPISPTVVEPPVAYADLDLSKPLANGSVSGEITVTWEAKTPVAAGEQLERDTKKRPTSPVTPIQIGGRYCLPGPSLRGMTRSVLEIATHSHLGRINHWRRHGVRTYQNWPSAFSDLNVLSVKAGWLTYDAGTKKWNLAECAAADCGYKMLSFDELLSRIPSTSSGTWLKMELPDKYAALKANMLHSRRMGVAGLFKGGQYFANIDRATFQRPRNARQPAASLQGYIVCLGASEQNTRDPKKTKCNEYFFSAPGEARPLDDLEVEFFRTLNSDPGRSVKDRSPVRNWRFWLIQMGYLTHLGHEAKLNDPAFQDLRLPGIPVFYVGTPGQPDFFFGLSRVLRLPWRYSVGQAAQNVYEQDADGAGPDYRIPRLPPRKRDNGTATPVDPLAINGWDFSRALFGWVEDDKHDGWEKPDGDKTRALAGRVAFGFAWAEGNPEPSGPVEGVLGAPRESFYPFYLKHKDAAAGAPSGATYDDAFAIPAGRKRYVARETVTPLPQPPDGSTADVKSKIHFLPDGTRFTGSIRFHNLDPIELGALLWALTFGEPDATKRKHRHQIGRAKPQGAGLLNATVALARVSTINCEPRGITPQNAGLPRSYLDLFLAHMQDRLGRPLSESPAIKTLLKTANPKVGKAAQERMALEMLPLEANRAQPTLSYPKQKETFDQQRVAGPRRDRNLLPDLPDEP